MARSPTKPDDLVEIDGCKIETILTVKLLGFYQSHVTEMTKKAAKRLYFLVQLKRAQVPPEELVQFYVVCIHINKVHYSDALSR